jgi:hypothetical protein
MTRRESVFTKPIPISYELCDFFGIPRDSKMSRSQVTSWICSYAKHNNLMNGQTIINQNYELRDLLRLPPNEQVGILSLQQYLKVHYQAPSQSDMLRESMSRTIMRNDEIKQELMEVVWHPDHLQRIIAENQGKHWNHEEKAYTDLDFISMADIL